MCVCAYLQVCRLTLQRQASNPAQHEWVEESAFVIGADGAGSALRDAMEHNGSSSSSSTLKVRRYKDKNVIVYRTIPLFWPKELADTRPGDVNYSARTKSGVNLDCLPTKEGPFIGVLLYRYGGPLRNVAGCLQCCTNLKVLVVLPLPSCAQCELVSSYMPAAGATNNSTVLLGCTALRGPLVWPGCVW